MKKLKLTAALLLTLALAACGTPSSEDETAGNGSTNENPAPSESEQPVDQEENKEEPKAEEPKAEEPTAPPQTKEIKFQIEGMDQVAVGTLAEGSSGKYYMYVFEDFELKAEDDGNDLLVFKNDEEFYVRIEPLADSANIEEIKTNSEAELKELGNVHDLTNDQNVIPFLQGTKFHLLGSGNLLSKHILVKEIDGQLYRFSINMPVKEAGEGVTPRYYAMLQTIETK